MLEIQKFLIILKETVRLFTERVDIAPLLPLFMPLLIVLMMNKDSVVYTFISNIDDLNIEKGGSNLKPQNRGRGDEVEKEGCGRSDNNKKKKRRKKKEVGQTSETTITKGNVIPYNRDV